MARPPQAPAASAPQQELERSLGQKEFAARAAHPQSCHSADRLQAECCPADFADLVSVLALAPVLAAVQEESRRSVRGTTV